jgi:uncharacterized membrane protein HdeD (DUF308 family)
MNMDAGATTRTAARSFALVMAVVLIAIGAATLIKALRGGDSLLYFIGGVLVAAGVFRLVRPGGS